MCVPLVKCMYAVNIIAYLFTVEIQNIMHFFFDNSILTRQHLLARVSYMRGMHCEEASVEIGRQ